MARRYVSHEGFDDLLAQQSQVVALSDAVAHYGHGAVRWRVGQGRWQRPRTGVLVTHSGPLTPTQQLWVDLLASGSGAVLAGLTAASSDGMRGFDTDVTHILVPHPRKVTQRPGIVIHRSATLTDRDVHPVRLPPRTRLARSLVDAAAWAATDGRARALLAAGVQQRLTRVSDLRAVVDRFPTLPRRRLIRITLDDVEGGAQALSEINFTRLVRRFGLPEPDRQVVRRDRHGRRRWLDVYFDKWGVVVEIDGFWHMEAEQWWADMDRDNELIIAGEQVLRYPTFVVREQPELIARQVLTALHRAGWSPDSHRAPKWGDSR